jgi:thiamine-phosphate pyrophosphorylase
MQKIKDHSLYLVITEEYGKGGSSLEIAEAAIAGGVDIIQMREKNRSKGALIGLGKKLARLCKDKGVTFIVNDDPIIAKEVDADGVHLGQEDAVKYTIKEAREALGEDKIIGISTHSLEQFIKANDEGFDYISFGPIFKTKTKDYFVGTEDIEEVVRAATKPIFFIGGINLLNIDSVLKEGAKNIALIRGITESADIASAAKEFKKRLLTGLF